MSALRVLALALIPALVATVTRPVARPVGREATAPPIVTITAREYAFDAPDSIASGPTTFRLVSKGKQQHFVGLVKIESPHTLADYRRNLDSPHAEPWLTSVGGVGTIPPGAVAATTLDLAPGLYAMVCDMEDPHGTPHFKRGMLRALVVLPKRNDAAMPEPDVTLHLTDYAFTLSTPLTAGSHLVGVRSEGTQPHMVLIWRLYPGKSGADVVRWMDDTSSTAPSPVTLIGGTPDLDPGRNAQLVLQLEPGKYVLICLVDDVRDHKPHYAHGMVRELVVGTANAQ